MKKIDISSVNFSYSSKVRIFQNLNVKFLPGKTALLGPNGAGKSTLISLMASVLSPSAGTIEVTDSSGNQVNSRQLRKFRRRVAWLPQDFSPVAGLSVIEHVSYAGWLKGMSRAALKHRAPHAVSAVGLEEISHRKATELSGGQQRRLGLAGALVHRAGVVLLDEPTAGLDPGQRERFRQILASLNDDHITVVSTHQTEDIDGSFNHVVVLVDGSVRFSGSVSDFMAAAPVSAVDPRDRVRLAYAAFVEGEI
ncbi:ATP-binding cassette domain-containing protein [Paeniglutamicibacter terrestris]|uniref:ATP-binding cassette domain-containing protein n=1 Tax=Paeniglutamicibacter terrestris TaxID=2723403 RepID=A0ABX1G2M2_9MICC|nr:ATP-binding cassette domain-containing protein [Paeniglutamicibacter terrestris]NKG19856.1 ATP-binding cassette domain-containing protein [Paeniglutamicibacter terrestris]